VNVRVEKIVDGLRARTDVHHALRGPLGKSSGCSTRQEFRNLMDRVPNVRTGYSAGRSAPMF
jgi:hypothetical protein